MKNVPIQHHYIPRFILRNFCSKDENICYFDNSRQQVCMREISNIFVVPNLYKDANSENPVEIEELLSSFENEASLIIKKFLNGKSDVELTIEENDKLMLFFAIMGFRSLNAQKSFRNTNSKEFYSFWQKDGNIGEFWKRNLKEVSKCRSIQEVLNSKTIDDPIKVFMGRDTIGLTGSYFIIAERRGNEDFVISDSYPVNINGEAPNGFSIRMYCFFPISPSRLLILAGAGVKFTIPEVRIFNEDLLTMPFMSPDRKKIIFHVRKMYEDHVKYVNGEMIGSCRQGFAFKDSKKVTIDERLKEYRVRSIRDDIRMHVTDKTLSAAVAEDMQKNPKAYYKYVFMENPVAEILADWA